MAASPRRHAHVHCGDSPVLTRLRSRWTELALGASAPLGYSLVRFAHIGLPDSIDGLPYADAATWAACARGVAWVGTFPVGQADWCLRRPLHPILLGWTIRLLGSLDLAMAGFALLMGIAVFTFTLELQTLLTSRWSNLAALPLLGVWALFALAQPLSESTALPLATFGTTAFLRLLRTRSYAALFSSTALMGLAELARPANPLLPLAPALLALLMFRSRFLAATLSGLMACALATKFTELLLAPLHLRQSGQGGNVWAMLYGLATGNRTWHVIAEIPGYASAPSESIRWRLVREATIHALAADPIGVALDYIGNVFRVALGVFLLQSPARWLILLLASAAWLFLLMRVRRTYEPRDPATYVLGLFIIGTSLALAALMVPAGSTECLRIMSTVLPMNIAMFAVLLGRLRGTDIRPRGTQTRLIALVVGALIALSVTSLGLGRSTNPPLCVPWQGLQLVQPSIQIADTGSIRILKQWAWTRSRELETDRFGIQALAIEMSGRAFNFETWTATMPLFGPSVTCSNP